MVKQSRHTHLWCLKISFFLGFSLITSVFSAVWDYLPVLCTHVVSSSGEWWCFPEYDWLLTRTHTHTHRLSHIITRPQTQCLFLSHMYTNFYTHSLARTDTHPDLHDKLCHRLWKYGAHFQGAHRVLKEKSISNVSNLIDSERRAEPTVVFCLSASDMIASTLKLTRIACSQGQRRGSDTGWKSSEPKADWGWGHVWIQLLCYYCGGKIALAFHFRNWIQERS